MATRMLIQCCWFLHPDMLLLASMMKTKLMRDYLLDDYDDFAGDAFDAKLLMMIMRMMKMLRTMTTMLRQVMMILRRVMTMSRWAMKMTNYLRMVPPMISVVSRVLAEPTKNEPVVLLNNHRHHGDRD